MKKPLTEEQKKRAREYARKHRAENPEKLKEYNRDRRASLTEEQRAAKNEQARRNYNPEKKREYDRKLRAENPEKARERGRKWYAENREQVNARSRQRRAENPGSKRTERQKEARRKRPEIAKKYHWKATYGITPQQFDELYSRQGDVCAICRKIPPVRAIDHDHASGAIRGVLCSPCNTGLGCFKDAPETLERAATYLRSHATGLVIPDRKKRR